MNQANAQAGVGGPELRGSNITLHKILNKTDPTQRQTKIICTLGPACWEVPQLEELIDQGMNVARFNFSHGDHDAHKACLDRLRQASANKKKHVGKFWINLLDLLSLFLVLCPTRCNFPTQSTMPSFSFVVVVVVTKYVYTFLSHMPSSFCPRSSTDNMIFSRLVGYKGTWNPFRFLRQWC